VHGGNGLEGGNGQPAPPTRRVRVGWCPSSCVCLCDITTAARRGRLQKPVGPFSVGNVGNWGRRARLTAGNSDRADRLKPNIAFSRPDSYQRRGHLTVSKVESYRPTLPGSIIDSRTTGLGPLCRKENGVLVGRSQVWQLLSRGRIRSAMGRNVAVDTRYPSLRHTKQVISTAVWFVFYDTGA